MNAETPRKEGESKCISLSILGVSAFISFFMVFSIP